MGKAGMKQPFWGIKMSVLGWMSSELYLWAPKSNTWSYLSSITPPGSSGQGDRACYGSHQLGSIIWWDYKKAPFW